MPAPPAELSQPERLSRIERGDLNDYVERHGEAASAVERLNSRVSGWSRFYACVKQALSTGATADTCK